MTVTHANCHGPEHEGDRLTLKANLRVKRIQFLKLGHNGRAIRTRNVAFLCLNCLEKDQDYQRPPLVTSPGMEGTRIASDA